MAGIYLDRVTVWGFLTQRLFVISHAKQKSRKNWNSLAKNFNYSSAERRSVLGNTQIDLSIRYLASSRIVTVAEISLCPLHSSLFTIYY
jgi:hypothetical protein